MLLDPVLNQYLSDLEKLISTLTDVYVEKYEEEIITSKRLNLRLRIRMNNDFLFELNEAVFCENAELKHLGYRYHFQDRNNKLIFRYDNTPHFHGLKNFPHHKHLPDKVIEAEPPDILEVIKQACDFILASP
ncbi:MAG: hypothetical protein FP816_01845 [Desulfobacteraceae bacterium]|nr:hypothetical protein [Desulfobacteraceae bacterium]